MNTKNKVFLLVLLIPLTAKPQYNHPALSALSQTLKTTNENTPPWLKASLLAVGGTTATYYLSGLLNEKKKRKKSLMKRALISGAQAGIATGMYARFNPPTQESYQPIVMLGGAFGLFSQNQSQTAHRCAELENKLENCKKNKRLLTSRIETVVA